MKTLKTLAALSFALAAFTSIPAHAATDHHATAPGIKGCPKGNSDCGDVNGPSLDGFAQAPSVKGCPKNNLDCGDVNGPSLDGIVDADQVVKKAGGKTAPGYRTCNADGSCTNSNGPSLDGFAQAPSVKSCPKGNADCGDVNGPSRDGFVDSDLVASKPLLHPLRK